MWFTNSNAPGTSIGRITTSGDRHHLHRPRHQPPEGITAGPDGALWFTNDGSNSIGRITTTGTVTNYTGPGINNPTGITAGPDGALWFTNYGGNSIGRITTSGTVTTYTGPGIHNPAGSRPGPDGALWFTNDGGDSIGRITTSRTVTTYTGPGIDQPGRDHGRPGRGAVVHQRRRQLDRADHHRRDGHQLHRHRHRRPAGITAGPDGALWFTNQRRLDRADHHHAGRSPTTPAPDISDPFGITAGPDGALWFTNRGSNSIGRITTAGSSTSYTGPEHRQSRRDHRRARWRAVVHQQQGNSIGRITGFTVFNYVRD